MRELLIVAVCAVYSVQAWDQSIGRIHVDTRTGVVPGRYLPLTNDDKYATRRASTLVGLIKNLPQLNPLRLPALGPYTVQLPEVNFLGNLQLANIVVNGIKLLSLVGVEVRMAPSRFDFNISIPQVSTSANFVIAGTLGTQEINVRGVLSATLIELVAGAAVGPKVTQVYSNEVYQVDSADVTIDLADIQLSVDMDQYAEDFRVLIVKFLQNTQQYPNIVDDILRAVLSAVNHELVRLPAKDIMSYLLGTGKPLLQF